MCIKSCVIISIISLLNTQTISNVSAISHSTSFSSLSISEFPTNRLIKILPVYLDENKRIIYRGNKNNHDRKIHHKDSISKSLNEPRILPEIPSLYLEPPAIAKHHWNNRVKKNRLKEKLKNNTRIENSSVEGNREKIYPRYIRDHAPIEKYHVQETIDAEMTKNQNDGGKNRIDFHIHGHQGPDSYIFGFDTGQGKNRQFRLEEKHGNGTVTGHYGYYDPRGKLRKIYYTSDPIIGYEQSTNGHTLGQ